VSHHSSLFDEPSRRLWLLSKALEAVPLKEALQLAQAAQDFLDGASPSDVSPSYKPHLVQLAPGNIPVASADRLGEVVAVATVEPAPLPSEAAPAEASGIQEAPFASTGPIVWAGPDDVVRYLRRADDVVVATDDGAYMVNGRFRENLEELVKRANRMRTRQRQPLFQLMPPSFARVAEDRVASAASAASRVEAEQVEDRNMIYGAEAVTAE
jgi:hypothetical protein